MKRQRSSIRRVETPSTYAWHTTLTSACSARRRGSNRLGKYEPRRSFGMSKVIVPARVSQRRGRCPLRLFTRVSLRSP
jgi:hypothetical protein